MLFDSKGASNRILVIDDNLDIHEDFRTILIKPEASISALDSLESDIFGDLASIPATGPENESVMEYELDFASQGQDGLTMLEKACQQDKPYFLAFVDMRMPPGWDGLETIQHLWAVDPDLQVVICTAYSDYSQREISDRLGMNDNLLILKKPFDHEEVSQLACALHQKREMTRIAVLAMTQMEQIVAERTEDMARSKMKNGDSLRKISALNKRIEEGQTRIIQSDRLAAGAANEIQNPAGLVRNNLGTVGNYLNVISRMFGLYEKLSSAVQNEAETDSILEEIKALDDQENIGEILTDAASLLRESRKDCGRVQESVNKLPTHSRTEVSSQTSLT